MDCWNLAPADPLLAARRGCGQALVDAIGRDGFATRALQALRPLLGAGSWAVYQRWPDAPPRLHLSASCGLPDATRHCFSAYEAGLYRRDRSFDALAAAPQPQAGVLMRMRAEEAPNADHRELIYRRHDMSERLSLARREADGSLLAINLYRHGRGQRFGDDAVGHLAALAPTLLAVVQRELDAGAAAAAPDVRQTLQARCPALTARELDVCVRLLRGLSHDGIAADLGLSVATVKTYRARAFARLGLHFRSELFARFGGRAH